MSEHYSPEHLLAYVNGNLEEATAATVSQHLASCHACRSECDAITALWDALGSSPDAEPGNGLALGFHKMLKGFEEGLRQADATHARRKRGHVSDLFRFPRPVFQLGAAACLLAIGLLGGYALNRNNSDSGELARLHEEVRGVSNLLAVSLLRQESASERLKGVSWSSRLEGRDPDIHAALVSAMKHDPNVNVRLAALEALSRDMNTPSVRHEIIHALPEQSSPLMQIALADVLVRMNDSESRAALQQVLHKPDLLPDVRDRITQGIQLIL